MGRARGGAQGQSCTLEHEIREAERVRRAAEEHDNACLACAYENRRTHSQTLRDCAAHRRAPRAAIARDLSFIIAKSFYFGASNTHTIHVRVKPQIPHAAQDPPPGDTLPTEQPTTLLTPDASTVGFGH